MSQRARRRLRGRRRRKAPLDTFQPGGDACPTPPVGYRWKEGHHPEHRIEPLPGE